MTFSLGLGAGGGGNYIRFQPSINSWQLGKEEIAPKKMIFDMDSIRTGWGRMAEGQAPEWVWDETLGRRGAKPGDDFKRGFSVRIYLGPDKGWAEWSSTGTGPCMGFEALAGEAMGDKEEGKALAVKYTGSRPEKVGKGNTRVPLFEVIGWVDKPADDDADEAEDEAPPPKRTAPPATGSKVAAPPAKKQPAMADDEDFG